MDGRDLPRSFRNADRSAPKGRPHSRGSSTKALTHFGTSTVVTLLCMAISLVYELERTQL